jgi:hypothetical protein
MPDLLNKPLKNSGKIEKVGKSVRWHHIVAGLFVYALIAGGLVWHATQSKQPTSHAAPATDAYVYVNIEVNGSNYANYNNDRAALYSGNYQFGNCDSGPNSIFYMNINYTSLCSGYQFGPPNGVTIQVTSLPDGLTVDNWTVASDSTDTKDNSCNASGCDVNFNSGSLTLDLTLNAPSSSSSGGSGSCTPSASSLSVPSSSQTSVSLAWTNSNAGCSGDALTYIVYKNGASQTETSGNNYTASGLTCNTAYSFYVKTEEINSSGSVVGSANSNTQTPTTAACSSGSTGGGSTGGGSTGDGSTGGGSTGGGSTGGGSTGGGSTGGGSTGGGSTGGGSSLPPSSSSSSSHSSSTSGLSSVGAAAASKTGTTTVLLSPQGNQTTSTPPNTPTGFTASTAASSVIVNLSWDAPTSGSAVSEYEIDRSTDNGATYQVLSNNVQNTFFSDLGANFSTDYLYRLVAKNASGSSGYTYASISTSAFKANAGPNQSTQLQSSDGVASALIPVGALSQPAACGLAINPVLDSPNVKGYVPVAGPYTVTCKTQTGSTIQSYLKPLTITVNTSNNIFKKYRNLAYYGEQSNAQTWDALVPSLNNSTHVVSFQLANSYNFIVMGQPSHAPWWVSFLIILLIIGLIGGGIILVIRTLNSRKQEEAYDVSYRKEWGL